MEGVIMECVRLKITRWSIECLWKMSTFNWKTFVHWRRNCQSIWSPSFRRCQGINLIIIIINIRSGSASSWTFYMEGLSTVFKMAGNVWISPSKSLIIIQSRRVVSSLLLIVSKLDPFIKRTGGQLKRKNNG